MKRCLKRAYDLIDNMTLNARERAEIQQYIKFLDWQGVLSKRQTTKLYAFYEHKYNLLYDVDMKRLKESENMRYRKFCEQNGIDYTS